MATLSSSTPEDTPPPGDAQDAAPAAGAGEPGSGAARDALRRLRWSWLPGNIGFNLVWGAVTSVLLALQIQQIDPAGKVGNLAMATGLGAAMTMLVQPVAGQLSDRTRSRFGRRAPWIVGGALFGAVAMAGMSYATTVPALIVLYLLVVAAYNSALLPMKAVLPDRVPHERRGTFSALGAGGQMLGTLGGQLLGSWFNEAPRAVYWGIGVGALVLGVGFVLLNPDTSSVGRPRRPMRWVDLLKTYWVSPRRHPDFAWVFTGRFLLMSGYFISHSYQLYVLQDYIGLGDDAVDLVPALSIVTFTTLLVFTLLGGPLSDWLGRRKVFIHISGAVFAIGLVIPLFLPTITGMFLSAVVGGIGYGVFGSVDTALMSQVLPSREGYGKDLGVIELSWSLPQTCGPFLAGAVVTATGSYASLFPIGAALALAGGFVVRFVKKVR